MASIDRVMAKVAAGLLPGLLPTPPRSTIAPCVIILPSSFASKPKPGRADSVERWDAHKKDKKPGSPASSSSSGSSSPGRASSCERWDSNKKIPKSSSTSSSSRGSSTSCGKWDSTKRPPGRPSSADRWDTHKKACSEQADAESRTGEQDERGISDKHSQDDGTTAMIPTTSRVDPVFSGSSYFASPDPSMLPMPTFFRSRCPSMVPVPAH